MAQETYGRVAIVCPGNREARRTATGENSRFSDLFKAFGDKGIPVELAIYHDDFHEEIREQLMQTEAVLVWVNPIEGGRDRSVLDAILREVAASGIFVSTHPDIILKLGTKEVLYRTQKVGWGSDTHLYSSMDELIRQLPLRLKTGKARVLKQNRGNGGDGVWKVQLPAPVPGRPNANEGEAFLRPETVVSVRHAKRGATEEEITLSEFYGRCQAYFQNKGRMIDQEYQERLPEGMVRCYLVHDKVAGFGHQAVNALFPAPPGASPAEAPPPGPRLYHPPTMPEFQDLKRTLEQEWVPDAQRLLEIDTKSLPVLWDCDFLLRPKRADGRDTYVLCEINVSSVAPYPPSVVPHVVDAVAARLKAFPQAS